MSHTAKVLSILKEERANLRHSPGLSIGGNVKLKRDAIANFSLPAGMTCPGAGACNNGFCYAQTGNYMRSNVIRRQVQNFLASNAPYFVDVMVDRIFNLRGIDTVRIHDSGDFYSAAYIEKWLHIISECKHIKFYAYTKSYTTHDLSALWRLENFNLIQSVGSRDDSKIDYSKPHAKIFHSSDALVSAGYVDCSYSDLPAAQGEKKVGLIIHGGNKKKFIAA